MTSLGAGIGVGWRRGTSIESISRISVDGNSLAVPSTLGMLRES
jgi:hypothetical protein